MKDSIADVIYKGDKVGVVVWERYHQIATFQYTTNFIQQGLELAPLMMPLRKAPYQFPNIHESYSGLPGLLADCLPDTYGNTLIDDWLRSQGRSPSEFTPVERLCYIGSRGMGALEFRPAMRSEATKAEQVDVARLVDLAAKVLANRKGLSVELDPEGLNDILRVGTSAGGARAKAVVAWNKTTNEVLSGQTQAPEGFQQWLMKFDGISESFDGIRDPQGYGKIEYAYSLMAAEARIEMTQCRLYKEGGRAHFMTRRFDRPEDGDKLHYASLFGIAHMNYSAPGTHSHSYENYFETIESLNIASKYQLEAFRRMVFNVLGCNKDDHTKNFGFLLNQSGQWQLAPAFDVTYAHNPLPGKWTASQQMSICGKRTNITLTDMITAARNCNVATKPKLKAEVDRVISALQLWPEAAAKAEATEKQMEQIETTINKQISKAF